MRVALAFYIILSACEVPHKVAPPHPVHLVPEEVLQVIRSGRFVIRPQVQELFVEIHVVGLIIVIDTREEMRLVAAVFRVHFLAYDVVMIFSV